MDNLFVNSSFIKYNRFLYFIVNIKNIKFYYNTLFFQVENFFIKYICITSIMGQSKFLFDDYLFYDLFIKG